MKTMTLDEFKHALKSQGVTIEHVALKCPMCGTVQSASSLMRAGAGSSLDEVEKYLGFSCVGRFLGAGEHKALNKPGKGCDWTLGGLFKLHKLEVLTPDGKRHPRFEVATGEEARSLMEV